LLIFLKKNSKAPDLVIVLRNLLSLLRSGVIWL